MAYDDTSISNYGKKREFLNDAVFSDGTSLFRIPMEPRFGQEVKIRLRTAKRNVDGVELVCGTAKCNMYLIESGDFFDYYETVLTVDRARIEYYFLVNYEDRTYYYTQAGISRDNRSEYHFKILADFKTPDWAKGAVFYQIFVDRFYNGNARNTVLDNEYSYIGSGTVRVEDWYKYPATMGIREFYGGDLQGVIQKLDYLKELGVEAIYFNPIFVSPSNHKYDIQDYDYVDPHFAVIDMDEGEVLKDGRGENRFASRYINRVTNKRNLEKSNGLFIHLVEMAHERGMKVILDGVFNHCGSFNKWLDKERIYERAQGYEKGAYVSKYSPYNKFFHFDNADDKAAWPYNGKYEGWWGLDTLPKLNYEESKVLYDYIMGIGRKWVSPPYNADGWRLDVAADLGHSAEFNHKFWKEFRRNVKEANPDALILAEHYGDPEDWLKGDEWDSVMNYDAFMEPVTWFLTGMQKHSDEYRGNMLSNHDVFMDTMLHYMAKFSTQSLQVAMNELSNHDHSRFLTRTNRRVGRVATAGSEAANRDVNLAVMREAVMMQMTWPGAPTVYYGDEAGVCGWTDPDSRRTYPWGNENQELIDLHKELIKIHKAYKVLKTGSFKFLYGIYGVICYSRFDKDDDIIIAVNNNNYEAVVDIPVWQLGIIGDQPLVRLAYTNGWGFGIDMETYWTEDGHLNLKLMPNSSLMMIGYPKQYM